LLYSISKTGTSGGVLFCSVELLEGSYYKVVSLSETSPHNLLVAHNKTEAIISKILKKFLNVVLQELGHFNFETALYTIC
jgi:hypothetical protein